MTNGCRCILLLWKCQCCVHALGMFYPLEPDHGFFVAKFMITAIRKKFFNAVGCVSFPDSYKSFLALFLNRMLYCGVGQRIVWVLCDVRLCPALYMCLQSPRVLAFKLYWELPTTEKDMDFFTVSLNLLVGSL